MIRNALLTLIGLVFCALAIVMLSAGDPQDHMMALGCLGFFGGCTLIGASLLRADLHKPKPIEDPAPQILSLSYDRLFHACFGVASWGMTAGSVIFALRAPIMWLAAGPALALFGLGGALLLSRAFDRLPVVTINPDGVFDRRIMSRQAPWSAIEGAGFPYVGPMQQLQIVVGDATPFRRIREGLFAWTGGGAVKGHTILITLQGLNADLGRVLAVIGANKPEILMLGNYADFGEADLYEREGDPPPDLSEIKNYP